MKLSVKSECTLSDVMLYLGTNTTLLNDGRYRTAPDIFQLVVDHNVVHFHEVNTDESHVCHLLETVFDDIETCCTEDLPKGGKNYVKHGKLDMVYFDQDHNFDSMLLALETWFPKLKKG